MADDFTLSDDFSNADEWRIAPRLYGIIFVVFAIIAGGLLLISRFNATDFARDEQGWKEKLNLIAESRASDVGQFVSGHFKELRTLSDNPSLKLYLSELQTLPVTKTGAAEPSQKSYLRNLLLFTAGRAGFTASSINDAIPANVPMEGKSGLVVLASDDQLVVSTPMAPGMLARVLEHAKQQAKGQEGLIDVQKDAEGTLYMGFSVPIYSIQGERTADAQIGKIIAVKTVDANLFGLLKHPGTTEESLEALLVRKTEEGKLEYISPLSDGAAPLSRQAEFDEVTGAEAALMNAAGGFINGKSDYRGNVVAATSRAVPGTPWTLIVKVDYKEAFAESTKHRADMVMLFMMIIAIIVLIIIAVWWYAHSRHALLASGYFKKLATRAQAQAQLLRLVTDHQPEPIYIVDEQQKYWFANAQVAQAAEMSPVNVVGKSLADIRGAARAAQVATQCDNALRNQQTVYDVQRLQDGKEEKVIRSAYIPLSQIPVASLPPHTPGVLVVEQDISEVIHEREERLNTQKQLVHTLVKLVDKRDPFAANHSMLVAQVAYEMAMDMELGNDIIGATRTAATLMNIGKIIIPAELLTKTGELSEEEKRAVRDSMNASADLLKNVAFDGPVAETLRQWQEKWDGTGPLGMKGEDVLISARIIAVANAFIGMISPRSWRNAMPIDAANKFLLEQADSYFDRRVVISLINYVENHSGRAWLKQILDNQKNAA